MKNIPFLLNKIFSSLPFLSVFGVCPLRVRQGFLFILFLSVFSYSQNIATLSFSQQAAKPNPQQCCEGPGFEPSDLLAVAMGGASLSTYIYYCSSDHSIRLGTNRNNCGGGKIIGTVPNFERLISYQSTGTVNGYTSSCDGSTGTNTVSNSASGNWVQVGMSLNNSIAVGRTCYASLSGSVTFALSTPPDCSNLPSGVTSPDCLSSCTQFHPISDPNCKGGQGMYIAGGSNNVAVAISDLLPNVTDYNSYGYYGNVNSISDTLTRPDGSQCNLFNTGSNTVQAVVCPLGLVEEPSSSSSVEEGSSSSFASYCSDPSNHNELQCICQSNPNAPECDVCNDPLNFDMQVCLCRYNPSAPECQGDRPSSGSVGNSSDSSTVDEICDYFPLLPICFNSSSSSSFDICDILPHLSVCSGGYSSGSGVEGSGCSDLSNCDWAKLSIQLQELDVSVYQATSLREIFELLKAQKVLSEHQSKFLYDFRTELISSGDSNAVGIVNAINGSFDSLGLKLSDMADSIGSLVGKLGSNLDSLGGSITGSIDSMGNSVTGALDGILGKLEDFFGDGNGSGGGHCNPLEQDCSNGLASDADTAWGITRSEFEAGLGTYGLSQTSLRSRLDTIGKDTSKIFTSSRNSFAPLTECLEQMGGTGDGVLNILPFAISLPVVGEISCGEKCIIDFRNFYGVDTVDWFNVLLLFLVVMGATVRLVRVAKTFGAAG